MVSDGRSNAAQIYGNDRSAGSFAQRESKSDRSHLIRLFFSRPRAPRCMFLLGGQGEKERVTVRTVKTRRYVCPPGNSARLTLGGRTRAFWNHSARADGTSCVCPPRCPSGPDLVPPVSNRGPLAAILPAFPGSSFRFVRRASLRRTTIVPRAVYNCRQKRPARRKFPILVTAARCSRTVAQRRPSTVIVREPTWFHYALTIRIFSDASLGLCDYSTLAKLLYTTRLLTLPREPFTSGRSRGR